MPEKRLRCMRQRLGTLSEEETFAGMPALLANFNPPALVLLETTKHISTGNFFAATSSIKFANVRPLPEMNTAIRSREFLVEESLGMVYVACFFAVLFELFNFSWNRFPERRKAIC